MKVGNLWKDALPRALFPWLWAAVFFAFTLSFSVIRPTAISVPALVLAVAFAPRLQELRTRAIGALSAAWALTLVPAISPGAAWSFALFFGTLALLSTEVARDQGLGAPLGRFFRSQRVRGWAAAVLWGLWAVCGLVVIHENLGTLEVPHVWRWSVLLLGLLCAAPPPIVGGMARAIWGGFALVGGFGYWIANYYDQPSELVFRTTFVMWQTLFAAGLAHEGWTKTRSPRPKEPLRLRSARIHSGEGLP